MYNSGGLSSCNCSLTHCYQCQEESGSQTTTAKQNLCLGRLFSKINYWYCGIFDELQLLGAFCSSQKKILSINFGMRWY